MAIKVPCPHCGQDYQLDDSLAGKKARCKVCKETFRIPAPHVKPTETSKSGGPVYRHEASKSAAPAAAVSTPYLKQITRHLEKHIGPTPQVLHEIVSDGVHLDLHIIPPTNLPPSDAHPLGTSHYTVVTSGLSAKPMNVPADEPASSYAELMVALPGDWPGMRPDGSFDQETMKDARFWWPLQWLKIIARMPHQYNTFIAPGHTIPNGEEAAPFASDTLLGCMMVFPSTLSHEASVLQINDQISIDFYALYPLYPSEMNFKLEHGLERLIERLMKNDVTELISTERPSVA